MNAVIADRTEFWWNERKPDEPVLWESKIELGEKFFNEIINHPVAPSVNCDLPDREKKQWQTRERSSVSISTTT